MCRPTFVTSTWDAEEHHFQNAPEILGAKPTKLLVQRLKSRVHTLEKITPLLREAAEKIDNLGKKKRNDKKGYSENTLFFHRQYHPNDISRKSIQNAFRRHLWDGKAGQGFKRMTVA